MAAHSFAMRQRAMMRLDDMAARVVAAATKGNSSTNASLSAARAFMEAPPTVFSQASRSGSARLGSSAPEHAAAAAAGSSTARVGASALGRLAACSATLAVGSGASGGREAFGFATGGSEKRALFCSQGPSRQH
mmetsp:Transcript_5187/g.12727  ORF Transcript_5187/g.12727 Transcript_5187/m.12727 type:complete len:134 (+) Transcript_5187:117-518(+)